MDFSNLEINKKEVLRYLGHKGQEFDEDMDKMIDECRKEVKNIITPRYTYMYKNIEIKNNNVVLTDTNLVLSGNDIRNHLKDAEECVLMAVTIGNDIEKKTRLYERTNLTKALILDACATTAVEEVCDMLENKIKEEANEKGMNITWRYSPGYGDLPIETQKSFIRVINAEKTIGLMASESNLLFPRKSVTAIIGIVNKKIEIKTKSCNNCSNYEKCSFRKEGENCGA